MKHYALSAFAAAVIGKSAQPCCPARPIENILFVGAKPHPACGNALSNNDEHYLAQIVDIGAAQGLPFSPAAKLWGCDYPSIDFLDADLRADMVVFCKIYFDPHNSLTGRVIDRSHIRQSPLSTLEGAWHRALVNTGAQHAVNVHKNELELPTPFINRPPYAPLTSQKRGPLHFDFLTRLAA
jgi:hypothetical protein